MFYILMTSYSQKALFLGTVINYGLYQFVKLE